MPFVVRSGVHLKRHLEDFLDRHRGPVIFLAAIFVIGVVFGALAVRSLEARDKLELVQYLGANLGTPQSPPGGLEAFMFRRNLAGSAKLLALLWVLGISVVGVLGVMVLALLRGFVTGFVVAFLAAEMGAKGVALALAGHVPQSLLEVPALILAGAASVGFSLQVFRSWQERRRVPNFYPALATYTATLLAMGGLLALAGLVESYLAPTLIQLASRLLQAP